MSRSIASTPRSWTIPQKTTAQLVGAVSLILLIAGSQRAPGDEYQAIGSLVQSRPEGARGGGTGVPFDLQSGKFFLSHSAGNRFDVRARDLGGTLNFGLASTHDIGLYETSLMTGDDAPLPRRFVDRIRVADDVMIAVTSKRDFRPQGSAPCLSSSCLTGNKDWSLHIFERFLGNWTLVREHRIDRLVPHLAATTANHAVIVNRRTGAFGISTGYNLKVFRQVAFGQLGWDLSLNEELPFSEDLGLAKAIIRRPLALTVSTDCIFLATRDERTEALEVLIYEWQPQVPAIALRKTVPIPGQADTASVAVEGGRLFVGAPGATSGGKARSGAVFIFEQHEGGSNQWGQVAVLEPDIPVEDGGFGTAVDADGDQLAIGMPHALNQFNFETGAVFVYSHDSGTPTEWNKLAKVFPVTDGSEGIIGSEFGGELAIDGEELAVTFRDRVLLFTHAPGDFNHPPNIIRPSIIGIPAGGTQTVGGLSISDPDAGAAPVTIQLWVPPVSNQEEGQISLASVPGGIQQGHVETSTPNWFVATAPISVINTTLQGGGLQFTAPSEFEWNWLGIHVGDNGNSGLGLPREATSFVRVLPTVQGILANAPPIVRIPDDLTVATGTLTALHGIEVFDIDSHPENIVVTFSVPRVPIQPSAVLLFATDVPDGLTEEHITSNGGPTVTITATSEQIAATLANPNGFSFGNLAVFAGPIPLTIRADDQGHTGAGARGITEVTEEVLVTNAPPNQAPDINLTIDRFDALSAVSIPITGITIDDDSGFNPIKVEFDPIIGDVEMRTDVPGGVTEAQVQRFGGDTIRVTATMTQINLTLSAPGGGLFYFGPQYFIGSTQLVIRTNDQGHSGSGGAKTSTASIDLDITIPDYNKPPTIRLERAAVALPRPAPVTVTGISVSDPDAGGEDLSLSITAENGTLQLKDDVLRGIPRNQITRNSGSVVRATGSLDEINTTLGTRDGLLFTPPVQAPSSTSITIEIDDRGNTGAGGALNNDAVFEVVIGDIDPYTLWLYERFGKPIVDNPQFESWVWGPLADLDRDGLTTLEEFYHNLDPLSGEQGVPAPLDVAVVGNEFHLLYREHPQAASVMQCTPEWSGDLQRWHSGDFTIETVDDRNPEFILRRAVLDRRFSPTQAFGRLHLERIRR